MNFFIFRVQITCIFCCVYHFANIFERIHVYANYIFFAYLGQVHGVNIDTQRTDVTQAAANQNATGDALDTVDAAGAARRDKPDTFLESLLLVCFAESITNRPRTAPGQADTKVAFTIRLALQLVMFTYESHSPLSARDRPQLPRRTTTTCSEVSVS